MGSIASHYSAVHYQLKFYASLFILMTFQVGDLGLSKVKCQTLISGGVRGTLPWMAPELLNGSSNLVSEKVCQSSSFQISICSLALHKSKDFLLVFWYFFLSFQVDVFSFGIVMWELVTGEEPYADLHYGAIIGIHFHTFHLSRLFQTTCVFDPALITCNHGIHVRFKLFGLAIKLAWINWMGGWKKLKAGPYST